MLLNQIYHNVKAEEERYLVAKRLNYWLHFESLHYLLQKNAYCVYTVMHSYVLKLFVTQSNLFVTAHSGTVKFAQ